MTTPSKQIQEQIKLMKLENENRRKLRDQAVEDYSGRETFRVTQEKKYAPLIEATKSSTEETSKELVSISKAIDTQNKTLTTQNEAIESYKAGNDELLENLGELKRQAAIEQAESFLDESTTTYNLPQHILEYLGNRDRDSLSIEYNTDKIPSGLYLGEHHVEHVGEWTMQVKNKTYAMSDGAWKLLTLSDAKLNHSEITEADIRKYCKLMFETDHVTTTDKNGKKQLKSSKSWKWKKLSEYGQLNGYLRKSRSQSTGSTSQGSGLVKFVPSDLNYLVGKLETTLGNIQLGHTNISKQDTFLATEIIDILKKQKLLSDTAYKNIYQLLGNHFQ